MQRNLLYSVFNQITMRYLLFLTALFFAVNANAQTETHPPVDMQNSFLIPKFYIDGYRANKWRVAIQLTSDERASRLFNRGANVRGAGYVTMGLGAVIGGIEYRRRINDGQRGGDNISNMVLYGSLGCIMGGMAMYYRGNMWQYQAIRLYNEGGEEESSLRFGPTYDGLGVTLTF